MIYPMRESWDYLIILDACRYDYFKKVFEEYIEGQLTRHISLGTWTYEWAKKNFTGHHQDIVYVSSNPYIRNKNNPSYNVNKSSRTISDKFLSEDHFFKIIDVWLTGWDEDLKLVPPEKVNQAALNAIQKYPDKKFIIHYTQPHSPYISLVGRKGKNRWRHRIYGFIRWNLAKPLGKDHGFKLLKCLGIPQRANSVQITALEFGLNGLKEVYENNLRIVLEYISKLLDYLEGKIIITSDHGELLGENGQCSHGGFEDSRPKQLIEIPWLEVYRDHARMDVPHDIWIEEAPVLSEDGKGIIIERLKALGYIE